MFIDTEDRGLINASLCRRIIQKRGEPGIYTFIFSEDEWIDAQPCAEVEIEKLCHMNPIIPAAAGFFHLKYHGDEKHGLFDITPIIGWRGELEYGAQPITVEGDHVWGGDANGNGRAIKFPDGRVLDQYNEMMFETDKEWAQSRFRASVKAA